MEYRNVPTTVAEMRPPKQTSVIAEAANFLRAHWDDVKSYYQVLYGETPSIHGAYDLDEAACVFKIQEIAKANGYAFLGSLKAANLRHVLRFANKRNTGDRTSLLRSQYKQRQITHQAQPPTQS